MKEEGADEHMMQTNNAHSPSTKHSEAKTISEVEETPEQQMLLQEDMLAEDPVPTAWNTDKGKGKYIPLNLEDDYNALLSPPQYKRS